jgi:pyruvate dehydrogenase E2 component (dihydrolipoamide acetyltransferase)
MTTHEFRLPDVGEGVAEGELLVWHVEVGDAVTEDQVVAEVETDKAVVDVPAPVDGTVAELRAEEGDVVPVGDVLIVFESADDAAESGADAGDATAAAASESPAESASESATESATGSTTDQPADVATPTADAGGGSDERIFAAPRARRIAREEGVDLQRVDGSGPGGRITESDVRAAAAADPPGEADAATEPAPAQATATAEGGDTAPAGRASTLAVPATRGLAHDLGVDIDDVPASERRNGQAFVTEADVRAFANGEAAGQAATGTEATEPAASTGDGTGGPSVGERVPYRGVRRTIGEQMERSKYTAPHVTHHEQVDVSELVATRAELADAAAAEGVRLTYTPFFLKAVVAGLREYPVLNSRLDEAAEEIVCYDEYHVGVAVDTDHGLMVPVVENVEEKGLADLAAEVTDLVERAQDRSLAPEELRGSTFTISNAGSLGGEFATPIINYPEAAILGTGAIRERPWVDDGEVVAREVLPLSLSFDHRVVDGADAARFVGRVAAYLEEPRKLLLE